MSVTMPEAAQGLKRFNGELLELEGHLLDILMSMQLKPKKRTPRIRPGLIKRPPPRHPSGGFPGYLFGGKGGEQGVGFPEEEEDDGDD